MVKKIEFCVGGAGDADDRQVGGVSIPIKKKHQGRGKNNDEWAVRKKPT